MKHPHRDPRIERPKEMLHRFKPHPFDPEPEGAEEDPRFAIRGFRRLFTRKTHLERDDARAALIHKFRSTGRSGGQLTCERCGIKRRRRFSTKTGRMFFVWVYDDGTGTKYRWGTRRARTVPVACLAGMSDTERGAALAAATRQAPGEGETWKG